MNEIQVGTGLSFSVEYVYTYHLLEDDSNNENNGKRDGDRKRDGERSAAHAWRHMQSLLMQTQKVAFTLLTSIRLPLSYSVHKAIANHCFFHSPLTLSPFTVHK